MIKPSREITVKDWSHFVALASEYVGGIPFRNVHLFRGQAHSDWDLLPSLVRQARTFHLTAKQTIDIEQQVLVEFKKQARRYLQFGAVAQAETDIGWWVLMQHHHVPTRLLDWTQSPYVALYFAIEQELQQAGAIWIVNVAAIDEYQKRRYAHLYLPTVADDTRSIVTNENAESILFFLERQLFTDRMAAQQTVCGVSHFVLADHGEILAQIFGDNSNPSNFVKLTIPHNLKLDFMCHLRAMNVTAHTLFPGVDGFGRSLAELLRLGCNQVGQRKSQ